MPAGDRTGPNGMGAMTGRGAGICAGFATPGYMNTGRVAGRGRGCGRGFARGQGFGGGQGFGRAGNWNAVAAPAAAPSVDMLKAQTEQLEAQLKAVREQIQAITPNEGE